MRYLIVLLTLLPIHALARELSIEDRACITAAAAKLPPVAALKIEDSRVVSQPPAQGQRNSNSYHVKVEIDVNVAGQTSTYVYNCIRDGQLTVIQPLGMAVGKAVTRGNTLRSDANRWNDQGVNILKFGADPTGVADSTSAIQAAIDSLNGTTSRVVFCPDGQYKTTQPIFLDPPGNLRGADGTHGQTWVIGGQL
jgi:hypothetical protein